MILDKLVEKKDLEAYLRLRADFLKSEIESEILKQEPRDRESIRERFKGRISELETTITIIKNGKLKDKSKWYYRKTHNTQKERACDHILCEDSPDDCNDCTIFN